MRVVDDERRVSTVLFDEPSEVIGERVARQRRRGRKAQLRAHPTECRFELLGNAMSESVGQECETQHRHGLHGPLGACRDLDAHDATPRRLRFGSETVEERRLAHARLADHRNRSARSNGGQVLQFVAPTDEDLTLGSVATNRHGLEVDVAREDLSLDRSERRRGVETGRVSEPAGGAGDDGQRVGSPTQSCECTGPRHHDPLADDRLLDQPAGQCENLVVLSSLHQQLTEQ